MAFADACRVPLYARAIYRSYEYPSSSLVIPVIEGVSARRAKGWSRLFFRLLRRSWKWLWFPPVLDASAALP
ncbi:MAG: hypothetical protein H5U08_09290 [Thermogutta sp.]|uniref:hypothetical protein n=1 Tax=Thermogutta sp. TaxID=1962930 RepID=UPI0019949EBE|nr:hypothetical protein [Thermogutta sp.]MBC7352539.1 hypothetical protein [Thermogutta sp.]